MKRSPRAETSNPRGGPRDDRGRPFVPVGLNRSQIIARLAGTSKQDVDPITRSERKLTIWMDVICIIAGGSMGALLWDRVIEPVHPLLSRYAINEIGTLLFVACGAIGLWMLAMPGFRRRSWRKISELYLASGQCPSCGYTLSSQSPQTDAVVTCPECGAAWRAERIGDESCG